MKVAIVGAGISGLSAANALRERQPGWDLSVFESADRIGGLLGSERRDGFEIEHGPDSILTEKPWALDLARRLGLEPSIVRTRAQPRGAFVVRAGRLERIPEGFSLVAAAHAGPLLRSPILGPLGKLRMLMEPMVPAAPAGMDESLEHFVVRRLGREVFERLAQPMVGGIYGADPTKLSLRATMPRLVEMEQTHGSLVRGMRARAASTAELGGQASGARYGLFIAFRGGMQTLVNALGDRLRGCIYTDSPVEGVEAAESGWRLKGQGQDLGCFDGVILAVPAYRAASQILPLSPELAGELSSIPYGSTATVTLAWPRAAIPHALDGFGFVVPAVEASRLVASTWSSIKYEGRAPAEFALIRVFIGGYQGQSLLESSDADLVVIARQELRSLIGVEVTPDWTMVRRYKDAMPQYHVGHLGKVERIEQICAGLAGLELAGNAYRGVGIPDAVRSGERAALALSGQIGASDAVHI